VAFHPYLAFAGNCREAFTRYQEIFGGELELLSMSDMPTEEPVAADQAGLIMHAALVCEDQILMGADDPTGGFDGQNRGMCVNVTVGNATEAARVFDALAGGGEVQMPLGETFFSPGFGMCIDRFGTPWMVNTEQPAGSA
jgi:PhnB protein